MLAMLRLFEGSRAAERRSLVVQDGPLQIPAGTLGSSAGVSPRCFAPAGRAQGAGPAVGSDARRGSQREAGWGAHRPETAAALASVWPPSLSVGNHFTYPDASVQTRCLRAALLSPTKPESLTQIAFHASLIETVRWALPFFFAAIQAY